MSRAHRATALGSQLPSDRLISVLGSQHPGDIRQKPIMTFYKPTLPSQPQGIITIWSVPNYTGWRERHTRVNNLPKVNVQWCRVKPPSFLHHKFKFLPTVPLSDLYTSAMRHKTLNYAELMSSVTLQRCAHNYYKCLKKDYQC